MKLSNKQHKDKERMDLEYDAEIIRYKQLQKVYLEVIDNQNKRITNLEQQLAKKNEEIKKHIDALDYWENNLPNQRKAIRKQVCDEIRGYFAKNTFKFEGTEMLLIAEINLTDFMNFLKKIEQGEER